MRDVKGGLFGLANAAAKALLSNLDRILRFDAEVADRTLDLRMSKKQLDRAQVVCTAIDQHRLCSPQRVGAELGWIEPDAGQPTVAALPSPSIMGQYRSAARRPIS
jgi:hypothetical protein